MAHDVNRWWHRVRGKEDPYLKIGEVNDRTKPAARAVTGNESRVAGGAEEAVAGSGLLVKIHPPKAEPERRGCVEEGCRRQARRALRVGRTANQISPKTPLD